MTAFLRLKAQRQKPRLRPKLDVRGALGVFGDVLYPSVVWLNLYTLGKHPSLF